MRLPRPRITVDWLNIPWSRLRSFFRPTIGLMMVVVALIASVVGFSLWLKRPVVLIAELAPPPRSASVDHEIYDIVLTELIQNKDFNGSIGRPGPQSTKVVLCSAVEGGLTREELGFFGNRMITDSVVAPDVLDSLVERNPAGRLYSIASYHPSNPNIVVETIAQRQRARGLIARDPACCGYVIPQLPGYSLDGQTAFFYFSFPWFGHFGKGYYLLKRVNGRWEIVDKEINIYL
jgi:hypothetical protein